MPTLTKTPRIIALSLLCLSVTGCWDSQEENNKEQQEFAVPVAINTLARGDISANYHSTAVLESIYDADVITRVTGIIEQLLIDEGDYVEKGQLLAQIDSRRYQLKLAQANAKLSGINQELARAMKMHNKQLISADRVDKLTYEQQAAKASRDLAALDLKDSHITAPISGFIAKKMVKQGHFTQGYQKLVYIVNQEKLQAVVHLPEHQLANVKLGQAATLSFSARPQQEFSAIIRSISPIINTKSGTFKVILSLDNSAAVLKPGMFAQIALVFATHHDALCVPTDAIISRDGQQYIFIVKDNKAQEIEIETGFIQAQLTEITAAIDAGAKVVVSGQHNLKNDILVNVLNSPSVQPELSATLASAAQ